ncbi:hypothetical protein KVR01_000851 [Diaporthe batatas]|uniref:uncharacterized protein n=1 Tax=Diaporthe batatas TaxID=748121 RepID=UPI001D059090|nr:uncharacterized protein KVR01_000851 [Diaporthe batatas]KAG8170106.1 hypothetical protein KVR01_000851 [Diaporthe batatas]
MMSLSFAATTLFCVADKFEQCTTETEGDMEGDFRSSRNHSRRRCGPPNRQVRTRCARDADADGEDICTHCDYVRSFLQGLRVAHWVSDAEGRELWFRRYALLNRLAAKIGWGMGRAGLRWVLDGTSNGVGGLERVIHLAQDRTWNPGWDTLEADMGRDLAELVLWDPHVDIDSRGGSGFEKRTQQPGEEADKEDGDQHDESDDELTGRPIWLYQDGQFVLGWYEANRC